MHKISGFANSRVCFCLNQLLVAIVVVMTVVVMMVVVFVTYSNDHLRLRRIW